MRSLRHVVSRYLEYLALAVVAFAAIAGAWLAGRDDADLSDVPDVPRCRDDVLGATAPGGQLCRSASGVLSIGEAGAPLQLPGADVRASAQALPARSASGRARDRMRITVRLTVRNTGDVMLDPDGTRGEDPLYLFVAGRRVLPDPAAARVSGALDLERSIEPEQARSGEVRFELAGAATRRVVDQGGAELGIRIVPERIGVVRLRFENLSR